jgi:hypothetical protein
VYNDLALFEIVNFEAASLRKMRGVNAGARNPDRTRTAKKTHANLRMRITLSSQRLSALFRFKTGRSRLCLRR